MTTEVEKEKRCSKCFFVKPISEFSIITRAKDGRQVKCKACEVKYRLANKQVIKIRKAAYYISNREKVLKNSKNYRSKNVDTIRESEKAKYSQIKLDPEKYAKLRIRAKRNQNTSRLRYPTHIKANSKVRTAIRFGKIVRPNECSSCGFQCKPEAHHDSYEKSQWLVVRWLCKSCHCAYHRKYPHLSK